MILDNKESKVEFLKNHEIGNDINFYITNDGINCLWVWLKWDNNGDLIIIRIDENLNGKTATPQLINQLINDFPWWSTLDNIIDAQAELYKKSQNYLDAVAKKEDFLNNALKSFI